MRPKKCMCVGYGSGSECSNLSITHIYSPTINKTYWVCYTCFVKLYKYFHHNNRISFMTESVYPAKYFGRPDLYSLMLVHENWS